MQIDKKSRVPLYAQLMDIVLEKISSGELKEHDQLPSEREWCELYSVSRTTVRQAMIELENEGYIYTQHGKGSYVAKRNFTQKLNKFYSFSEEMSKLGKKQINKVVSFDLVTPTKKIVRRLQIQEDELVYKIRRLRFVEEEPILMETTYLPQKYLPDLQKTDLEKFALYDVIRNKYNLSIQNAVESFQAVALPSLEASYLQVDAENPGMRINRIAYSSQQIIEYTVGYAHGEKYSFSIELD